MLDWDSNVPEFLAFQNGSGPFAVACKPPSYSMGSQAWQPSNYSIVLAVVCMLLIEVDFTITEYRLYLAQDGNSSTVSRTFSFLVTLCEETGTPRSLLSSAASGQRLNPSKHGTCPIVRWTN